MKKYLSAILIAGVLWSLSGCGGSSGNSGEDTGNSGGDGHNVVINDAQSAKNSYAVLGEAVSIMDVTEDVTDFSNFVNMGAAGRALETVHEGTYHCAVSGTVDHILKKDTELDPVKFDVSLAFNQCKMQEDVMWDGKATYQGSAGDWNISYQNFKYVEDEFSVILNTTMAYDVKSQTELEMTYNGTLTRKRSDLQQTLNLENFVINARELANDDISLAVDGKVTLTSNPATCADGVYTIQTVERVVVDHTSDDPISGKVKVNGTEYTFNQDGTVTATVNGKTVTFDQDVEDINCSALPQS